MKNTVSVVIEYDSETKTFGATSPDLPDIYAVSDSREDAIRRFESSADQYLRFTRKDIKPEYVVAKA